MRLLLASLSALLLVPALVACTDAPGSFSISFLWDVPPEEKVYIWVRVEERDDPAQQGRILDSAGPDAYVQGESMSVSLESVAHGTNRVVVVEVRSLPDPNQSILYYGLSKPFELRAGDRKTVEVPMYLRPPETEEHPRSVSLLFEGEPRVSVSLEEAKAAVVQTRSVASHSIILDNLPSFVGNLTVLEMGTDRGLECVQEEDEDEGATYDVCNWGPWNLTAGLEALPANGKLTVYAKFVDLNGYESPAVDASVNLDSMGPRVMAAKLSSSVVNPGGQVLLTVSLDEQVKLDGGAVLSSPGAPAGVQLEGPVQVGDSTSYQWAVKVSDATVETSDPLNFDLTLEDQYGNKTPQEDAQPPLLCNKYVALQCIEEDGHLQLTVDATPPQLVNKDDISFDPGEFNLQDDGEMLSVELKFLELHPLQVLTEEDGRCVGLCPTVALGHQTLGALYLMESREAEDGTHLTFRFDYELGASDWQSQDVMPDFMVSWSDETGNPLAVVIDGLLHFDFKRPLALSCSLQPEAGNMYTTFTYSLTAGEPLSQPPELLVEPDDSLFAGEPDLLDDGLTWVWSQSADNLPSQTFTLSARLTDMAGNESLNPEDGEPFLCPRTGSVDGEAPELTGFEIRTEPEITDPVDPQQPLLACGPDGKLIVDLTVQEATGLAQGSPSVVLAVPGSAVPLTLDSQSHNGDTWQFFFVLDLATEELPVKEGQWPIKVSLKDTAENQELVDALGDALVAMDFTPPAANCSLGPDPAGMDATIALTIQVTEPQQAGYPEVTGDLSFLSTGSAGNLYTYAHVVDPQEDAAVENYAYGVKLMDLVGNTSQAGGNCQGMAALDAVEPLIGNGSVSTLPMVPGPDGEARPWLGPGGTVVVAFDVTETQAMTAGPPDVYLDVGGDSLAFVQDQADSVGSLYSYTYSLAVPTDPDAEGFWPVRVVVADAAGNSHTEQQLADTLVLLDFTAPTAKCSVSPSADTKVGIGETAIVQITPLEQLYYDTTPELVPADGSELAADYFAHEPGTEYTFIALVEEGNGEHPFAYDIHLVDQVGNDNSNACSDGELSGFIDGTVPEVTALQLTVADGTNPAATPLRKSLVVLANLEITNTQVEPSVFFGPAKMVPVSGPAGEEPWSWQFSHTLLGDEGDGPKDLVVSGIDGAGNPYDRTEAEVAVCDFTAPAAQCLVNTANGKEGVPVRLTVVLSEQISGMPTVTTTPPTGSDGEPLFAHNDSLGDQDAVSPSFVFEHTVAGGEKLEWSATVKATDLAGNPVGGDVLCTASGATDGSAIAVLPGAWVEAFYLDGENEISSGSFAGDGARVAIEFSLDDEPAADSLKVKVGGKPASLLSAGGGDYEYEFVVNKNDGIQSGEVIPATVELEDEAGNQTFETVGSITTDFVSPEPSGLAYVQRCDNYADATVSQSEIRVRTGPLGCTYGSSASPDCGGPEQPVEGRMVRVTFPTSETLNHGKVGLYIDDQHQLSLDPCSQGAYIYATYTVTGDEPADQWLTIYADLADLAGNRTTGLEMGKLYFDFAAPAPPEVDGTNKVVYTRLPWGVNNSESSHDSDGKKRFSVRGHSGSVEENSRVTIYDGAQTSTAAPLATELADGSGRFGAGADPDSPLTLTAADRAYVYITTTDLAGNQSDADDNPDNGIQASLVRDIEWVATLDDKVVGSYLENPHRFESVDWFQWRLRQENGAELGESAGVGAVDGELLTTTGKDLAWLNAGPPDTYPDWRKDIAMTYDSVRGAIVLFGGSNNTQYLDETWEWSNQRWTLVTPTDPEADGGPSARTDHAMTYDSRRGRVVLFGGKMNIDPFEDTWEYDGSSWALVTPADPEEDGNPPGRSGHAITYDSRRGRVVMFGGYNSGFLPDLWEFNGDSWVEVEPLDPEGDGSPLGRLDGAMAFDRARGVTVLFGGSTDWGVYDEHMWEYDGASWTTVEPLDLEGDGNPAARTGAALVYDSAYAQVLLHGGSCNSGCDGQTVWAWDGQSWDRLDPEDPTNDGNPGNYASHAAAYDDSEGRLVIYGGGNWSTGYKTWLFDGTSWADGGPMDPDNFAGPGVRQELGLAFDSNRGRTVMFGGKRIKPDGMNYWEYGDVYEFNGFAWKEIAVSDDEGDGDPGTRHGFTMAYAGAFEGGEVVLFGGRGSYVYQDDVWLYDGQRWKLAVISDDDGDGDPGAKMDGAMAYDSARSRVVHYAGWGSGPNNQDPWELRRQESCIWGFCWWTYQWKEITNLPPEGSGTPWNRTTTTMTYDATLGQTVMYGGQTYQPVGETWEWSGSGWTEKEPADPEGDGDPGSRYGHVMAYDSARQRTLLGFGSTSNDQPPFAHDLWEWNGQSWRQLSTADPEGDDDPGGRLEASMAVDSVNSRVVLHGGQDATGDVWLGRWGLDKSPGHIATFSFWAAGNCAQPELDTVSVTYRAGGTSYLDGDTHNGARLLVWDEGAWAEKDQNTSSAASPGDLKWTTQDEEVLTRLLFGDHGDLVLGVIPLYFNKQGSLARVSTDHVELYVRYRVPANAPASCE